MKLEKIGNKEFDNFAIKHKYGSFMQNSFWGKLKEKNGWDYELLGAKENNKLVAATLLLSKKIPTGKMFYAPRGYLLDYTNLKLFEEFDSLVSEHAKENGGLFIKIDPYVEYHERDRDNNIIEGGTNNQEFVDLLKKLKYKEQASKKGEQSLQAKWMYWINLKDKSLDDVMADMTSKTRQMIRKNEKNGVVIREGTLEEVEEFKHIMDHTSDRRGFLSRPVEYLKSMYEEFGNGKYLKLIFADLMIEEKLNEYKNEYEPLEKDYQRLLKDIELGKKKIGENKLKLKTDELDRLKKQIEEYEELYEKHGSKATLGAIFYFVYGNEVLSFMGGAYDEFLKYQSFYTIHYEMIKYAIENGYEHYNFYGISSDLSEKDDQYGIYQFKKGFGGQVVELVGEYDKKLKGTYLLYKGAYAASHKLKKIKAKSKVKK
jgi:lipid II:glycine glycyltransferase (peptidoglycan interpeptide bridge formation enzyme)